MLLRLAKRLETIDHFLFFVENISVAFSVSTAFLVDLSAIKIGSKNITF